MKCINKSWLDEYWYNLKDTMMPFFISNIRTLYVKIDIFVFIWRISNIFTIDKFTNLKRSKTLEMQFSEFNRDSEHKMSLLVAMLTPTYNLF